MLAQLPLWVPRQSWLTLAPSMSGTVSRSVGNDGTSGHSVAQMFNLR